jgi:hypothetical protein
MVHPISFSLCVLSHVSVLGTMRQLSVRKQKYKLRMFKRLYYILLGAVAIIAVFFVISSVSFSDRLAEGVSLSVNQFLIHFNTFDS